MDRMGRYITVKENPTIDVALRDGVYRIEAYLTLKGRLIETPAHHKKRISPGVQVRAYD